MLRRVIVLLLFVFSASLFGQVELPSIVAITSPEENSVSFGSGVVIRKKEDSIFGGYIGYILTAEHVVSGNDTAGVFYTNNKNSKFNKVVARDKLSDIAVIRAWVPEDIEPIEIGQTPEHGEIIQCYGFPLKIFKRRDLEYLRDIEKSSFFDGFVFPGDSGGPILRKGKLISVVSGGWFWVEKEDPFNDKVRRATWPPRGATLESIKNLLSTVD